MNSNKTNKKITNIQEDVDVDEVDILKGILSVTFNKVNSPIKGVITFLSVKESFKQDIILTLLLSKIVESILASNKPSSSADDVKVLLSYSILTFAYG